MAQAGGSQIRSRPWRASPHFTIFSSPIGSRERHHIQAPDRGRRGEDLQGGALRPRQRHRDRRRRRRRPDSTSTSSARWAATSSGRISAAASFEDITASAGVGVAGKISVSASFADIDNDGDPDLYVTTVRGGNMLFENDGHGRFRDITAHRRASSYAGHSSAAVFFDYDRDGRLDLFLVNVGQYTTNTIAGDGYKYYVAFEDAFSGHLKPERAERSILYHNEGRNRFVDVSKQTGLRRPVMVGRRERRRRERRRLAGPLRAQHAGRRSVLRERRRQAAS